MFVRIIIDDSIIHSKKIGALPNLCPGEEPLRFRTDFPNLKRFRSKSAECFLGSENLYETLKVLPLGTGSVEYLFFLECRNFASCLACCILSSLFAFKYKG